MAGVEEIGVHVCGCGRRSCKKTGWRWYKKTDRRYYKKTDRR
jgi:hypothetical protein